jgi:DNA polymerase V
MMRLGSPIGHLDSDAFYCSAERVRFDDLRSLPLAVLGNQGACVIARSYEMRESRVGVGIPIWEAIKLCPDGVYLKRDFRWYEVLSRAMLAIVRDLSGHAEYYSIDEFFFDATPPRGIDCQKYAEVIRDRLWESVGVPVTVGIARTRTLAKLISDSAKPFGALAVLDREAETRLLADRPVTEVTGIAGRRAKRLLPWGIRTCLDLANADRRLVRSLLTATGEGLWWELNGEPSKPILADRPRHKVISRGGSLGESTDRPSVLWAWYVRNLERLVEELEYYEVLAGKLTVWMAYRSGEAGVGSASMVTPTDRFDALLDAGRSCVRRAWIPRASAMRMHLFAEDLRLRTDRQLGLFEPTDSRAEALARVKHEINSRLGRFALRSGATLPLHAIYRDTSNGWDICDVKGKTCF